MQYRYFAAPVIEVKRQFIQNYGECQVLAAETQDQFLNIIMNPVSHTVVIFDSFLFFDLLTENNIYHLPKLKKYFKYIVFSGDNLEELCKRINSIKKNKNKK